MKHLIIVLSLLLSALVARAQYIEEIGSLESLYEVRARSVLNTILRPTEYTLVVSVELDRDEKKLKEFHEEAELQYLPGMPMMGDVPVAPMAANKLHEMKAKTDISVVLSRNVSPEVEKVIRDLLVSKLHLDSTAGDAVNIRRIELPMDPKVQEPPKQLPELTWKTWVLIVILSLLALAGLMFAVWRRSKNADPKKDIKENHEYVHEPEEKPEPKPDVLPAAANGPPAAVAAATAKPDEMVWDMDLESVRQHVIQIGTQYPQMASRAIAEYCLEGAEENTTYLMDFIGWDTAKHLFTEIPAMAWGRMGRSVKERSGDPLPAQIEKGVRETYRALLAAYIEHEMVEDEAGPFNFVLKLRDEQRTQILEKESAKNIAILCLHAPSEVTAGILGTLDGDKKIRVMGELSRIEKIPHDVLQSVIQAFKQRVSEIRLKPEPKVDGATVLSKVVRGMSPEEEMNILTLFAAENPSELERVRRSILIFEDVSLVPKDILSEVLGLFEVESLYGAFFRCQRPLVNAALSALPEKKAMILERELSDMAMIPSQKVTAETRRKICLQIETILEYRSITMTDLIDGAVKVTKIRANEG
jgi:flagellar motor switch protein FliG